MFFCLFAFFVNDFSTTRGPIHAKVCMRAYSGSGCVFPLLGVSDLWGRKRGKWNFRYYRSQWGIFAFWWFLSDISATRGRIHPNFICVGTMSADLPLPLWGPSARMAGSCQFYWCTCVIKMLTRRIMQVLQLCNSHRILWFSVCDKILHSCKIIQHYFLQILFKSVVI